MLSALAQYVLSAGVRAQCSSRAAAGQPQHVALHVLILWFGFILRLSLRVLCSEGELFIHVVVKGVTRPVLSFTDRTYRNVAQVCA